MPGILKILHGLPDVRLATPGEGIAEWKGLGLAEREKIAFGMDKGDETALI